MHELALFAGIGGGILGGQLLGWKTVCAVEIDPFCREVLLRRQLDGFLPRFPIWDDIRTFDGSRWRNKIDIISGGFPCQDISPAGTGGGLDGKNSGLWSEMRRAVREVQPKFAFVENSPMLTARGLGRVLSDLAEMGYDARWGVFPACFLGAPHTRERVFIVAHSNSLYGKKGIRFFESLEAISRRREVLRRKWLESISRAKRGRHGVPFVVDRLRTIGNGQVPTVAVLAWEILSSEISNKHITDNRKKVAPIIECYR